jgi:hypothetical protein
MTYSEILPNEGVGNLRLGMSRHQIRNEMNVEFRQAVKGGISVDQFTGSKLMAFYDQGDACVFLEFYSKKIEAAIIPTLNAQPLLGEPYQFVESYLFLKDPEIHIHQGGLVSRLLGIHITALPETHAIAEGVAVGIVDDMWPLDMV